MSCKVYTYSMYKVSNVLKFFLASCILVGYFSILFYTPVHMMEMADMKTSGEHCPFMVAQETICTMTFIEHLRAWQSWLNTTLLPLEIITLALFFPIQFAAGALMNTAGSGNDFVGGTNGYGNVQFNGLSSLSNGYIVDGLETNDPLTNLNSGLSTNLVLGLNSIAEMTVNTLSYAVDQGRYGASQINYVTKSGTNRFHGNLYELWNGSRFNAANFFTNSTPGNQKPRSTVNHFGGSLGGSLRRNKLFFFVDTEWVRIALPLVSAATVPTPAFRNYVLRQLPLGGTDSVTGTPYQPSPQSVPFYQKLFALYGNTAGTPLAVLGCPFNTDGSPATGNPPNGNGCANRRSVSQSSADSEQVQTVRVDYNADQSKTFWLRLQHDGGLQAAYTDPINPVFNALSPQPLYSVAAGYTHVFSPRVVNYFNPAFSWYESLFGPADFQKTLDAFPIVLEGSGANAPFTRIGGLNDTWVQGRRAARFFLNDNLAWSLGAHELRFGANSRILRLNDYDFGQGAVPVVTWATLPQFIYGVASTASRTFALANSQPYNFLNLDLYAQDTWKVTRTFTWTFGLRVTHNSNPANPHRALARLSGSFDAISHDVNQPLREAIHSDQLNIFAATPMAILQPRMAVAWQFASTRVARRVRVVQRHPARQRGGPGGRQPSLLEIFRGRPARQRRRVSHRTGSSRQRGGCNPCGQPELFFRLRPGPAFVCVPVVESGNLPPACGHHRRTGWHTARAVQHAMEPGTGASAWHGRAFPRPICGHPRLEPAVSDPGKWLPDGLRRLLCAVPLWPAD